MAVRWVAWVAMMLLVSACGWQGPEAPPAAERAIATVSVTRWTDRTELFAEYPPLTVGQTSRFAIHLTRLDTFQALGEGRVEVRLSGGGSPEETFQTDRPSRPGIFGVDVAPAHAGSRELTIVVRSPGLDDQHRAGSVRVYTDVEAVRSAAQPQEEAVETIRFLKEQQWSLEFGTALVETAAIRETLRVPAVIAARPGGSADVVAPIDGRLVDVADVPPGTTVRRGQQLARVQPRAAAPAELPQLQQMRAEAASALEFATRDRERAERLVAAGAAPQKRLDEAVTAETQARARVSGAEARLSQYQTVRSAGTTSAGETLFVVRSPLNGVVAERTATTGANVAEGTILFRVVDAVQVQVAGQVPEADFGRARQAKAAELEAPGRAARVPVGRLTSLGRVIDPGTRTVPITFSFENRELEFAVGQSVFLHLLLEEAAAAPVVASSAIVDDAGRPIVFVQREGEAFERRAVTIGGRSGDLVQVTSGVKPGERVVTRGAHLVRLAALSTQVPAQGHLH